MYPINVRLPPEISALAMALSSVSVVLSSLALRLHKPHVINAHKDGRHQKSLEAKNELTSTVHHDPCCGCALCCCSQALVSDKQMPCKKSQMSAPGGEAVSSQTQFASNCSV